MQVVVQFLTDPIVAGILTLLGAVTTLGDFLKLWDFGPLSLLRWIRARINQAFWSVPKETLRIIPMDRPWPWGPASIQGRPAMQVVMDFYFTNITTEPALVVGTHLTAYYWKWKVFPRYKKVKGHVFVQHPTDDVHGTYQILPRATTEGRADWYIEPPIREAGHSFCGRACFIDRFGNEHWTQKLIWEPHP